jgi:hypothetical protein
MNDSESHDLRDYFAAHALMGILAVEARPGSQGVIPVDENTARFFAIHAWRFADAMLQERKKQA